MYVHNCWYVAAWSRDIKPDSLVPVTLLDEPLVLYRKGDGGLVALADRCCHRLAPLSLGRTEGDDLRCMYHGFRYAPDGRCVEIPGQRVIPPKARVRSYPVVERHSCAWLWMGDPQLADATLIPDFVGVDDAHWAMRPGRLDYQANYRLINDNLLDLSHLAYVHRNTFGGGDAETNQSWADAKVKVTQRARGVHIERWIASAPSPPSVRATTGPATAVWSGYDFVVPGILLLYTSYYHPGAAQWSGSGQPTEEPLFASFTCQAVTPLTASSTCYFFAFGPWARHAQFEEQHHQVALAAFAEDQRMIEAQQRVIDAAPGEQMLLVDIDRGPALFDRILERLMQGERIGEEPMREPGAGRIYCSRGADPVYSTLDQPRFEFAFECRLKFTRVLTIPDVHNGGFRSAVLVDEGSSRGRGCAAARWRIPAATTRISAPTTPPRSTRATCSRSTTAR